MRSHIERLTHVRVTHAIFPATFVIPLSETMFSPRLLGTYQFVKNEQGVVTHMLVHSAEEVLTAVRKR